MRFDPCAGPTWLQPTAAQLQWFSNAELKWLLVFGGTGRLVPRSPVTASRPSRSKDAILRMTRSLTSQRGTATGVKKNQAKDEKALTSVPLLPTTEGGVQFVGFTQRM